MIPSHRLKAVRFVCAAFCALSSFPYNTLGVHADNFNMRVLADCTTTVSPPTNARSFDRDSIKRQGLDATSKRRLEVAKTLHGEHVWFIAASQRNKNAKVVMLLKHIGGEVAFRSDDIDYIRGNIPTAKAEEFAADENVMDISIGE